MVDDSTIITLRERSFHHTVFHLCAFTVYSLSSHHVLFSLFNPLRHICTLPSSSSQCFREPGLHLEKKVSRRLMVEIPRSQTPKPVLLLHAFLFPQNIQCAGFKTTFSTLVAFGCPRWEQTTSVAECGREHGPHLR